MRPTLFVQVDGGRTVRVVVKLLVMLALAVLGVYIMYGLLAAILAGFLALLLVVLGIKIAARVFRG